MKSIEKNKENVIKLLEKILDLKIQDVEFAGIEHFYGISEYKFSLFKIKIKYHENEIEEIYLKMIKGGKIKETIFCYWSLLFEEYLKGNKMKNDQIQKKVIISQRTTSKNNSNIVLMLSQGLDYCAEINLVELKEITTGNKNLERWVRELDNKSEDILFIGLKKIS